MVKTKKKVVIVDDDKDLLNMLIFSFKEEGFAVEDFTNGKEALKYLLKKGNLASISLLVLDRVLPDMDGLEIFTKIKAHFDEYPPVLFLSVLASEKDILKGLRTGADDYITKPFNIEVFMQKAERLIHK